VGLVSEPTLWLDSSGLLSKYGFNDGDEQDEFWDWRVAQGIEDIAWHPTLRRLVREHLMPRLDQQVDVYDIDTIHNPIRASTVDGIAVDDMQPDAGPQLTPDGVAIPYAEVLRIAREESE
jgi:hypothetical protein